MHKRNRPVEQLLDPAIIDALSRGAPTFDRAGLLAALLEEWGGANSFARDIVLEFQHAKAGTIARQRYMDMICRLISQHSNDVHYRPVEEMNDEELRAAVLGATEHLKIADTADG